MPGFRRSHAVLLSVPIDALHPYYSEITSYRELPKILIDQIAHFFKHYKDLESGKWVEIKRWGDPIEAFKMIERAIQRAGHAAELKEGKADKEQLADAAQLLLDQARIMEGEPPKDPTAFARRISGFIERGIA